MGSNITTATVRIEGNRPLLWHYFGPDAIPLEKQEKLGVAGNNPEEWRSTCCVTPEGQLFLPNTYLFGCIRDAAPFTDKKRRFQSEVCSSLQILDTTVLMEDRFLDEATPPLIHASRMPSMLPDVFIYVCGVRNPATGARNVRYRLAAAPGWQCTFSLMWDISIVSRPLMQSLCIDAGRMVGLGDARRIGFGRFEVKEWDCADTS